MIRKTNYIINQETIIPIEEVISQLKLNIDPKSITDISIVEKDDQIVGIMICGTIAHKHEEVKDGRKKEV